MPSGSMSVTHTSIYKLLTYNQDNTSLGDPSRRLCYWTGWDPKEIVRAALSTDFFFEVWEVIAPSVNAEYVAMSMS